MTADKDLSADKGLDSDQELATDQELELFSDYYEETLALEEKQAFERRLKQEPSFAAEYSKFEKTMEALSGMHKMSAPVDFDKKVEDTIHQRSGGRFFGRKAFGDKIPYELIAILVMIIAALLFWVARTSETGSHRLQNDKPPEIHDKAREALPIR